MTDFSFLGVGDKVWAIPTKHTTVHRIVCKVSRITKATLVLDWFGDGSYMPRFYRINGYEVGGGGKIEGLAGPDEIARWEQSKAQKRADDDKREAIRAAKENTRNSLLALFHNNAIVEKDEWSDPLHEKWSVTINNLDETRVRSLAEVLKQFFS